MTGFQSRIKITIIRSQLPVSHATSRITEVWLPRPAANDPPSYGLWNLLDRSVVRVVGQVIREVRRTCDTFVSTAMRLGHLLPGLRRAGVSGDRSILPSMMLMCRLAIRFIFTEQDTPLPIHLNGGKP